MKAQIHPKYVEATVTCSCGNTFTTRSTRPSLRTDLCSVCHPFYTGEQRIVDTAGQVERFTRRMEAAQASGSQKSKRQRRLSARAEEIAAREAASAEAAAAAEANAATEDEAPADESAGA